MTAYYLMRRPVAAYYDQDGLRVESQVFIDNNKAHADSELLNATEADSWIAAKAALGFELTDVQKAALRRERALAAVETPDQARRVVA